MALHDKTILYSVFKAITELVHSDGGDGAGHIWCRHEPEDYKELANLYEEWFEMYRKEKGWPEGARWQREDRPEQKEVAFISGQEYIIISNKDTSEVRCGDYLIRI